jgi:hypothetical protein
MSGDQKCACKDGIEHYVRNELLFWLIYSVCFYEWVLEKN